MAHLVTWLLAGLLVWCGFLVNIRADDAKESTTDEKWKKKNIRDYYTDSDLNKLYEQWEEADEDLLEPDELPEHKRPPPKIDISSMDPSDPESILKASKSGRTLMMFATLSGNPTRAETEAISKLWQSSLFNAHYDVNRLVVGDKKVLFIISDGATTWPVKEFLVNQDRCEKVTIDGTDYPGMGDKKAKAAVEKLYKESDGVKMTNVLGRKMGSDFRHDQEL